MSAAEAAKANILGKKPTSIPTIAGVDVSINSKQLGVDVGCKYELIIVGVRIVFVECASVL